MGMKEHWGLGETILTSSTTETTQSKPSVQEEHKLGE